MSARIFRVFAIWVLRALAISLLLGICALLAFLLARGLPVLGKDLFFGDIPILQAIVGAKPVWNGIWPACAGTLYLVVLSVVIVLFPGIGCGIYLAEFPHKKAAGIVRLCLDVLAGTPSIVMGLFGFTLILFLRHSIMPQANTSLLLAAFCIALLILPALSITACHALEAVPESLRLGVTALGFSRSAAIWHVYLPAARQGISAGIILATGRTAEDTAVIMLTGAVANAGLPAGLGMKFEALSFSIFYAAAQYQNQEELARSFGATLILLSLSALLLLGASIAERRFRRGFQGRL